MSVILGEQNVPRRARDYCGSEAGTDDTTTPAQFTIDIAMSVHWPECCDEIPERQVRQNRIGGVLDGPNRR